jgi:peptidoglycan hydrolase-like protein with peptidoglycan-binding domain
MNPNNWTAADLHVGAYSRRPCCSPFGSFACKSAILPIYRKVSSNLRPLKATRSNKAETEGDDHGIPRPQPLPSQQGEDISLRQRELQQLGAPIAESEVARRFFGESTRQAVTRFQPQQGLEPTGVVDQCTATQIHAAQPHLSCIINGLIRREDGRAMPTERNSTRTFASARRGRTALERRGQQS